MSHFLLFNQRFSFTLFIFFSCEYGHTVYFDPHLTLATVACNFFLNCLLRDIAYYIVVFKRDKPTIQFLSISHWFSFSFAFLSHFILFGSFQSIFFSFLFRLISYTHISSFLSLFISFCDEKSFCFSFISFTFT